MTSLTDTQVVTASGGLVELGYGERTTPLSVTTSMQTVVGPVSVVHDGSPVLVELFSPYQFDPSASSNTRHWVYLSDGSYRQFALSGLTTYNGGFYGSWRYTPPAGTETYEWKTWADVAGGVVGGGTAAAGQYVPAFLRVSKIVQATQWPAVTTGTIICTSTTRPASPFEGQEIYETDTKKKLTWNGSGWYGFLQVLGKSIQTSPTTTVSEVDVTGLSATVSAGANRIIKVTVTAHPYYVSSSSAPLFYVYRDSTKLNQFLVNSVSITTSPASTTTFVQYDTTPSSGSFTYKVRMSSYGGNTVGAYGNPGEAGVFLVEDIGPA